MPNVGERQLDARYTHRGVYSAWLSKFKSDGAKAKWFQTVSRRYFTIDFENQIFFYSHGEADKKTSLPVTFKEILGAAPGSEDNIPTTLALRRSLSGATMLSPALQISTAGAAILDVLQRKNSTQAEYSFIVHTCDRRIRLAAERESEANSWIEMLHSAHRLGCGLDTIHRQAESDSARPIDNLERRSASTAETQSTVDYDDFGGLCSSSWSDTEAADGPQPSTPAWIETSITQESSACSSTSTTPTTAPSESCISSDLSWHGDIQVASGQINACSTIDQLKNSPTNTCAQRPPGRQLRAEDFGFLSDECAEDESPAASEASPVATPRLAHPKGSLESWSSEKAALGPADRRATHMHAQNEHIQCVQGTTSLASDDEGDQQACKANAERVAADLKLMQKQASKKCRAKQSEKHVSPPKVTVQETLDMNVNSNGEQARIAADLALVKKQKSKSRRKTTKPAPANDPAPSTSEVCDGDHAQIAANLALVHGTDGKVAQTTAPPSSRSDVESVDQARVAADLALMKRAGVRHR